MKATTPPTNNDPILTAYVLDELPRDEAAQLTALLGKAGNQKLREEVESIDSLSNMLTEGLQGSDKLRLSPSQRSAIFQSAKTPTASDVESTYKKQWLRPVLVTLGAAAAVTIAVVTLQNMDAGKSNATAGLKFDDISDSDIAAPITASDEQWTPTEGAKHVSSGAGHLADSNIKSVENGFTHHPAEMREAIKKKAETALQDKPTKAVKISENSWEMRADNAMTRLPLVTGNSSWQWLQQWIKSADNSASNTLDPNLVRIDEIINNFEFKTPSDLHIGNIQLGIELIKCPWDGNHFIAAVLVQNRSEHAAQVEAAVTMAEAVSRYRLIGYAQADEQSLGNSAPEKINMRGGYSHLVLYEIELAEQTESGADVISVSLRASDKDKPTTENSLSIQHSNMDWKQASQDVQFSLILASWAQVLSNSKMNAGMTAEQVSEMMIHFSKNHTASAQQAKALVDLEAGLKLLAY